MSREVRRQARLGCKVRLMFQDEARFGLLGDPRRCWAPSGMRPLVKRREIREYTYAYAAVSPHDGVMDSLILPWVNAETMSLYLDFVAGRHPDEYILMVMDCAGWHIAKDLSVPKNMRVIYLPPYSPELNPAEHLWDALRERHFGNRMFKGMEAVTNTLCRGLREMENHPASTQKLAGFDWITSILLNAN